MKQEYPLIIVFYLDVEMMKIQEIIQPFVESVNNLIQQKDTNALAFFLPTTGEERIECINPTVVKEADMEKINQMVKDIQENFSVGVKMDVSEEPITPENQLVIGFDNLCPCGGDCKCD